MLPLFRLIGGSYLGPLHHAFREADGVRGVFASKPIRRGDLLMAVPLTHAYLPHGWTSRDCWERHVTSSSGPDRGAHQTRAARDLRRSNRVAALLPEFHTWLHRLSPDAPADRVSLSASASDGASAVMEVHVSPVEAAIVVSVALRHFFGPALGFPSAAAARLRATATNVAPPPTVRAETRADRYVSSLPMGLYMAHGVESLFTVTGSGDGGVSHACLEQIAWNLRDACLTHATNDQYRFYDENPSLLDAVLVTALYVVRARVLTVSLLANSDASRDGEVSVLAPGLDLLNHASGHRRTAAAAVSADRRHVVVRAVRDVWKKEEITLDYGLSSDIALPAHYMLGANHTPVD